jgi:hypothetical protein
VTVGLGTTLLRLIEETLPDRTRIFLPIRRFIGTALETTMVDSVYRELPPADFSKGVLGRSAARLAVLPVRGVAAGAAGAPRGRRGRLGADARSPRRVDARADSSATRRSRG